GSTITFTAADDPGYQNGEEVFYDNGGGTSIGGLCSVTDKQGGPPSCRVAKGDGEQAVNERTAGAGRPNPTPRKLAVGATTNFAASGKFTVDGGTGTCSYASKDDTHFFTVTGCTGTVSDGASVMSPNTLKVNSTAGFNTTGNFTVEGIGGICTYSGKTG